MSVYICINSIARTALDQSRGSTRAQQLARATRFYRTVCRTSTAKTISEAVELGLVFVIEWFARRPALRLFLDEVGA